MPPKTSDRDYGARRRRKPLPPLTRSVAEPVLPYAAVLDEHPAREAWLLWRLLHDAALWSSADPAERAELFADEPGVARGIIADVETELDSLDVLVRDPHPDAGPLIARMCHRVMVWAESRGHPCTALAFAQAAALADPEDAGHAYEVGRLARKRGEFARAEAWYRRGAVLGNRTGDKEHQARSYGGLANLYSLRGNFAAARQLTEKMERLARRHALREAWGGSCHGMAVLDFEAGDIQQGIRHARKAIRMLGADHPWVPSIVHDMAVGLMDRCGAFAAALDVLRTLLPHLDGAYERLVAQANLARAAGATGQSRLFEALWTDVWARVSEGGGQGYTSALIALGRGACSLRRWDLAREAAERALRIGEAQKEGKAIHLADALLASIPGEQRAEEQAPSAPEGTPDESVLRFASDLVGVLRSRPWVVDGLLEPLAAAIDAPDDPTRAYALGRALRAEADYERAEAWFGHAMRIAREVGDARTVAMCLGSLGNLHAMRGDLALALDFHQRHREFARHEALAEMEGYALVDLCAVSFAMDRGEDGLAYAAAALPILPPGHPALPRLGHDVAVYLMEARGDYENALLLFRSLERGELAPPDRLFLVASTACAAAGAGHAQLFEEAWSAVWEAMEGRPDGECHAKALVQLAHGALLRGHADLAERAARRARAAAIARGEAQVEEIAEGLVEAAVRAVGTHARTPPRRDPAHDRRAAFRLARGIARALRPGPARRWGLRRSRQRDNAGLVRRSEAGADVPGAPVRRGVRRGGRTAPAGDRQAAPHVDPSATPGIPGRGPGFGLKGLARARGESGQGDGDGEQAEERTHGEWLRMKVDGLGSGCAPQAINLFRREPHVHSFRVTDRK